MEEEFYDFESCLTLLCFVELPLRAVSISFRKVGSFSLICHPNLTSSSTIQSSVPAYIFSRMVKTFDCVKCGGHHARPINRNCKVEKDKDTPMDTNMQILKELQSLSGCMTQMEDRMETLGFTSSSPARSHVSSVSSQKSPTASERSRPAIDSPEQDLLLPTLASLRQSRSIQEQMDSRIKELQGVEKSSNLKGVVQKLSGLRKK